MNVNPEEEIEMVIEEETTVMIDLQEAWEVAEAWGSTIEAEAMMVMLVQAMALDRKETMAEETIEMVAIVREDMTIEEMVVTVIEEGK